MNMTELKHALVTLRLSGMASVVEMRILEAQTDKRAHLDFLTTLVVDELDRRAGRLIGRRIRHAAFRDVGKTIDTFDFDFNKKLDACYKDNEVPAAIGQRAFHAAGEATVGHLARTEAAAIPSWSAPSAAASRYR